MADSKKYYWLKLKRDFFKRHDIRIIETMPNGKDYVLFYLKLLLESVDHEGNLRFSDTIPYSPDMLSVITNTNVDIVRSALKIFSELNMVEILDDSTIFMSEVQRLIGFETSWAEKKRKFRQKEDNVLAMSSLCPHDVRQEIEKDKELELDLELEKDIEEIKERQSRPAAPYKEIVDLYNSICISYPKVKSLSDARKRAINARLKTYSVDDFKVLFEKAELSDFLKGNNARNWSANFDWLIADTNMAKVLDGNYDGDGMKTLSKLKNPPPLEFFTSLSKELREATGD